MILSDALILPISQLQT